MKKYITTIILALVATFTFGQIKLQEPDRIHFGLKLTINVIRDSTETAQSFIFTYRDASYTAIDVYKSLILSRDEAIEFVKVCEKAKEEDGTWQSSAATYTVEKSGGFMKYM